MIIEGNPLFRTAGKMIELTGASPRCLGDTLTDALPIISTVGES